MGTPLHTSSPALHRGCPASFLVGSLCATRVMPVNLPYTSKLPKLSGNSARYVRCWKKPPCAVCHLPPPPRLQHLCRGDTRPSQPVLGVSPCEVYSCVLLKHRHANGAPLSMFQTPVGKGSGPSTAAQSGGRALLGTEAWRGPDLGRSLCFHCKHLNPICVVSLLSNSASGPGFFQWHLPASQ